MRKKASSMKNFFTVTLSLILIGAAICLVYIFGFEGLGMLCLLLVLEFIEGAAKILRGIFNLLFGTGRKY